MSPRLGVLNSTITVFPELVFSKRIKSNSIKQVKMAIKIHVLGYKV